MPFVTRSKITVGGSQRTVMVSLRNRYKQYRNCTHELGARNSKLSWNLQHLIIRNEEQSKIKKNMKKLKVEENKVPKIAKW